MKKLILSLLLLVCSFSFSSSEYFERSTYQIIINESRLINMMNHFINQGRVRPDDLMFLSLFKQKLLRNLEREGFKQTETELRKANVEPKKFKELFYGNDPKETQRIFNIMRNDVNDDFDNMYEKTKLQFYDEYGVDMDYIMEKIWAYNNRELRIE